MKEIKLQIQSSLKIECASLDPNHTDHIQGHFDDIVMCRKNAGKVIWATLNIEQKLDYIIKTHLFDRHTAKTDFFMSHFLQTNRIDFSTKRQVALAALKESNRLEGKSFSKLDKLLSDINKKRNACAHGNICESTERGIILEYYQGSKKTEALNDAYWTELEEQFQQANEIIDKI